MAAIEEGVVAFNTLQHRLPTNIDEVVTHQLLPERSVIYRCPLLYEKLWSVPVSFKEVEYEFEWTRERVSIMIPEVVYEQKRRASRFSWLFAGASNRPN